MNPILSAKLWGFCNWTEFCHLISSFFIQFYKVPLKSFDLSHFDMWSLVKSNSFDLLYCHDILKQEIQWRYFYKENDWSSKI